MNSYQKHKLNMNSGRCITKNYIVSIFLILLLVCDNLPVYWQWFMDQDFKSTVPMHSCVSASWIRHLYHQLKHFTPLQMHLGFLLSNVGQVSTNKSILTNLNLCSHWHMYQYGSYRVIRVKIPFRCATNNNNQTSVSPL